MYRTVIVPVGYGDAVDRAVAWGATVARQAEAELVLLTVKPAYVDEVDVYRDLRELADQTGVKAQPQVVATRDPAAAIIDAASEPDTLLCMQTRARGALAELTLGSVSEQVLRTCHRPVLLIGPHCGPPPERLTSLVVALDGSAHSELVLPVVGEWSQQLGLSLWLFEALPAYVPLERGELDVDESVYVHRMAALLADRGVKAEWDTAHSRHPAQAIAAFADEHQASAIALTTHGHSGLGRMVLGSVALQVAQHAEVPILVLRPEPAT